MKLRITARAVGFELREVSTFHLNRGGSLLGRVYLDAVPFIPAGGRTRATAHTYATDTDSEPRWALEGAGAAIDATGDPS